MLKNISSILALSVALSLASCGQKEETTADTKIVGGTVVDIDSDNPGVYSAVSLMLFGDNHCTGVLVAENLVLTAAHCVASLGFYKEYLKVGFLNDLEDATPSNTRNISEIQSHPDYKGFVADIAWVKFDGDIPEGYKPVDILKESQMMIEGLPLTLTGFGTTIEGRWNTGGTKRTVDTVVRRYITGEIYDPTYEGILVFGTTPEKSACHGDSGGPAYVKLAGKWYVVGTTMGPDRIIAGTMSCHAGNGLYAFIAYYADWIEESSGVKLPLASIFDIPTEEGSDDESNENKNLTAE